MSGTLARPAAGFSLAGAAIDAANARRLAAAALAVVALHVGLLALRPGAASGTYVAASAPPVMAVRMLRARPPAAQAPIAAQLVPLPAPAAAALPPLPAAPSEAVRPLPVVAPTVPTPAAPPGRLGSAQDDARPAPAATTNDTNGAQAPLAAAPDYAFGVRLDPGPRPLEDIEPDYPDTIHLREGVVVLRLLISDTGHVDDVAVVRAEPRGVFEQAAIDAFAKARFSPGLAAGTPVKSQIMVEVQFMPINRGARVSGRTY
jgi:periplasmic protein TonB